MNYLNRLGFAVLSLMYQTWLDKVVWDKMVVEIFNLPSLPYFTIMFGSLIFKFLISGNDTYASLLWNEWMKDKSKEEYHSKHLNAIIYSTISHTIIFLLLNAIFYLGWQ